MKAVFYLLLLGMVVPAFGQFNPQTKKMTLKHFPEKEDLPALTPALKKSDGFTNYPELIGFLEKLCADHPDKAQLSYIGETKKGLKIPMLRVRAGAETTKVKVWMQGGLHGDEPASTEALLYLLHDLLYNAENSQMLSLLDLAVVPMANIDGYLKQERNNAEDLDLNRDQTKLMAVESPLLKKAFSSFKPHVALDFHEYRPFRRDFEKMGDFGVTGSYDVMFLNTGNLNVPLALRNFNKEVFLKPTQAALSSHQLSYHDYVTTIDYFGAIHFNQGSENPRSSVTNFSLQNTLATLIEVRGVGIGRTSIKRRVFTGYLIAKKYLEIATTERENIFQVLQTSAQSKQEVVVNSVKKVYQDKLDFIDLDKNELIKLDVTIRDALQSTATRTRKAPKGYFILPEWASLVEKIKLFGLEVETIPQAAPAQVEQYLVKQVKVDPQKFEKMNLQEVETVIQQMEINLPAGTFYVRMDQRAAAILPELLEPEAGNSFVSLGVLPAFEGKVLPIFRKIND